MQRVTQFRLAHAIAALIGRLPLPFSRLPVEVRGHRMFAHSLDRYLALWLWKFRLLEASEANLLAQFCKQGMRVVDVGANIGFYSLLFAERVAPTGHVWAFEPDLENFSMLRRNLRENGYLNVSALNSAVGAASGKGHLYLSNSHRGDHRIYKSDSYRTVRATTIVALDEYFSLGQTIDLIKMDIQGAEGMALSGMKRIIRSNPGLVIFMEFWPMGLVQAGSSPEEVFKYLHAQGLTLEEVDKRTGELREVKSWTIVVNRLGSYRATHVLARSKP